MRFSQQEKMEIIRLVENSKLGIKRTLINLGINKSTFYNWYARYQVLGYDGIIGIGFLIMNVKRWLSWPWNGRNYPQWNLPGILQIMKDGIFPRAVYTGY